MEFKRRTELLFYIIWNVKSKSNMISNNYLVFNFFFRLYYLHWNSILATYSYSLIFLFYEFYNLRQSHPRYVWRWGEVWLSATICTMAMYGVWDICVSFFGTLGEPNAVPAISWTPSLKGNHEPKTASRWRFFQDVHHEVLPSDPRLQLGRIPKVFP